tara:strand:- start:4 stop:156 length:153 start_codon:yes stop_codon:yes gene_type:complete
MLMITMEHIVNRPAPRCNPALKFLAQILQRKPTQRSGSFALVPFHFRGGT